MPERRPLGGQQGEAGGGGTLGGGEDGALKPGHLRPSSQVLRDAGVQFLFGSGN